MKILKSLCFLMFFPLIAFSGEGSSLLVGGGLNMSSSNAEDETQTIPPMTLEIKNSPRFGFNAGVDFEAWINDNFSVIPGLSLETRGEKSEVSISGLGADSSSEGVSKLLYLQIPILFQGNVKAGKGWLNIFAGPEVGFLVSKAVEMDGEEVDKDDIKMKTFDFGLAFGVGFEMAVGSGALCIRPSYYLGLTDAGEDDDATTIDEAEKTKHRNLKIKVAYKIPLVK